MLCFIWVSSVWFPLASGVSSYSGQCLWNQTWSVSKPHLAPSPAPLQSLFWVNGVSPISLKSAHIYWEFTNPATLMLAATVWIELILNRSCYLLCFLQPFAACLSWAPSLPGVTHVQLACSPLPEGLCCFHHFLYIFILDMFRCPQIGISHHLPKFCTQTEGLDSKLQFWAHTLLPSKASACLPLPEGTGSVHQVLEDRQIWKRFSRPIEW